MMAPTHGVCFSLQRKYYDLLWQVECCSARAGAGQRVNPISLALSRFLWQHIGADDCSRPPTSPTHTTDRHCVRAKSFCVDFTGMESSAGLAD